MMQAFGARALLTAVLMSTGAAYAAPSIVGDSFQLSVSYDDPFGGPPIVVGPVSGVASGDPHLGGGVGIAADADAVLTFDMGSINVHALWVDADTVHLFFQGAATEFTNLRLVLSGLNFADGVNPAAITGASFNPNGGGSGAFGGFNEVMLGIVANPTISFTPTSVTTAFSFFSGNLTADGPVMEVNVTASNAVVSNVPEPSTYALLLGGMGLIGLARRRSS